MAPAALGEVQAQVQAQAQQLLGLALARRGERWGALAALSACVQLYPHDAHALLQRGTLLLLLDRIDAAIADLSAALPLRPGWPRCLHRRGFAHSARHAFDEAAADFEAAASGDPSLRVNYLHVLRDLLPADAFDDDPEWQPATALLDYASRDGADSDRNSELAAAAALGLGGAAGSASGGGGSDEWSDSGDGGRGSSEDDF